MLDQCNPVIDNLQQDIEDVIDSILGEKASRSKREELIDSIYNILHKHEEKYLDYLKYAMNEDLYQPLPTNNSNYKSNSSINIYLLPYTTNSFSPSTFYNFQPNSNALSNPYQMPMIQSSQYMASPTLNPYIQSLPMNPYPTPQSNKSTTKSKKKSHKHNSKSKSKHSKSGKNDKKQKKNKGQFFKFDKNSEDQFKGIIHYLTEKCGGNVSDKGVVAVTSSSICSDKGKDQDVFLPRNAVDFNDKSKNFVSRDLPDSWLLYDFKERKVRPTNYSIRSRANIKCHNPKNWVIEGSNSGSHGDWEILDTQVDVSVLDGLDLVHTFDVKSDSDESFRFLRIRQNGKNHSGQNYFIICALEYYGYLY